jgi:penicillin-binding protein 2
MFVLLTILFFRLWYFQVIKSPELVERAEATRVDKVLRPAPRGLIFDRSGTVIAGLRPEIVVTAVYNIVSKKENAGEIERVAAVLGVPPSKLEAKFSEARQSPGLPVPIFVGATEASGTEIAESANSLPGIGVSVEPMRYYPDTRSFANVLGYVRLPSPGDIKRIHKLGKEPAPFVGKTGIEQFYETDLMGEPGDEVVEVDSKRRPLRVVQRDSPVPGKEVVATLDASIQQFATQIMEQAHYKGGIAAVDPATGEVVCLASSPTYDNTAIFQDKEAWKKLISDPDDPMIPRPIHASYSPGSTFKIVTSLAAYEKGIFDPNRTYFCNGGYRLGKAFFKCLGHHGNIAFKEALIKSCNTYFSDLGYRAGPDALRQACAEVGLGESSGIDIHGESLGVVPTDHWMRKRFKHPRWYGGQTVNFAIGQGYLRATPLQMCNVAAMVANEGTIYRPHLVREIRSGPDDPSPERIAPEVLHHVNADPSFWSVLKTALVGVVERGTAQRAQIPNVIWAGKTGSAEHGKNLVTHSWFVGFAPVDHPKIAICVLVEDAGHGGDVAAPIAKEIVERYLGVNQPKPRLSTGPAASISAAAVPSPKLR